MNNLSAIIAIIAVFIYVMAILIFDLIKFMCFCTWLTISMSCLRLKEFYIELYDNPVVGIPIFVFIGMIAGWGYHQIGHLLIGVSNG